MLRAICRLSCKPRSVTTFPIFWEDISRPKALATCCVSVSVIHCFPVESNTLNAAIISRSSRSGTLYCVISNRPPRSDSHANACVIELAAMMHTLELDSLGEPMHKPMTAWLSRIIHRLHGASAKGRKYFLPRETGWHEMPTLETVTELVCQLFEVVNLRTGDFEVERIHQRKWKTLQASCRRADM